MSHIIQFNDGKKSYYFTGNTPERLPKAGDLYTSIILMNTLSGAIYQPGDYFLVIERTNDAPYHKLSSIGNLLIKDKFGNISIWSEFDHHVANGIFKLDTNSGLTPKTSKNLL